MVYVIIKKNKKNNTIKKTKIELNSDYQANLYY